MQERAARADRALGWVLGGSLAVVAAAHLAYPAVAIARGALVRRPWRTGTTEDAVSVIVAAHDEAAVIEEKLRSVLDAVPPGREVEVVVVDDGSTDGTAEAVRRLAPDVRLLTLPRSGKAAALEAGVAAATGDVLVFTDANSMFLPGTLEALLAPFADPAVGGVAGDQEYLAGTGHLGERVHWSIDRCLKRAESRAGSTVSATGALYAIRGRHFAGVPEGVTDDFWISTGVVADGARLVFSSDAVVREPAASDLGKEHARKVRVMTRGLTGVLLRRELLHPRHGFYAASLLARKVVRRLTALPLVVAALVAVARPRRSRLSAIVAAGSVATAGAGAIGLAADPSGLGRHPVVALPAYACMSVVAALQAVRNVASGTRIVRWEQGREAHDLARRPT